MLLLLRRGSSGSRGQAAALLHHPGNQGFAGERFAAVKAATTRSTAAAGVLVDLRPQDEDGVDVRQDVLDCQLHVRTHGLEDVGHPCTRTRQSGDHAADRRPCLCMRERERRCTHTCKSYGPPGFLDMGSCMPRLAAPASPQ